MHDAALQRAPRSRERRTPQQPPQAADRPHIRRLVPSHAPVGALSLDPQLTPNPCCPPASSPVFRPLASFRRSLAFNRPDRALCPCRVLSGTPAHLAPVPPSPRAAVTAVPPSHHPERLTVLSVAFAARRFRTTESLCAAYALREPCDPGHDPAPRQTLGACLSISPHRCHRPALCPVPPPAAPHSEPCTTPPRPLTHSLTHPPTLTLTLTLTTCILCPNQSPASCRPHSSSLVPSSSLLSLLSLLPCSFLFHPANPPTTSPTHRIALPLSSPTRH